MIYRIINAYTIRIVISLLFICILRKINKVGMNLSKLNDVSINDISKRDRIIGRVILILLFLAILVIPYEDIFLRFKTPEEVLNYYYPTNIILKKYDYEDYAYILFNEGFVHFVNRNGKWIIGNRSFKGNDKMVIFNYDCSGQISEIKEKNITGVQVECYSNKSILVEDLFSSKFDEVIIKRSNEEKSYVYFTTIKGKLDKNYIITINGKEYNVFDHIYKGKYITS